MGGLRGLGGARAGGGLRLAAAGPALPRAGGLLLSQVPGGLGTSDPGVPAWGSGAGGREVGATPVMKEQPLETWGGGSFGGDCGCVSQVGEPSWSPMPPSPPAPKGVARMGGIGLPGSAAASSSARGSAALPAPEGRLLSPRAATPAAEGGAGRSALRACGRGP